MFTGIVQTMGRMVRQQRRDFGLRLLIEPGVGNGPWPHQVKPGDSVSVSGVCLTHAPRTGGGADELDPDAATEPAHCLAFDVIPETLARTSLGQTAEGDLVNLEPALVAGQPLGGHIVQGHVDATGTITAVQRDAQEWRVAIRVPADLIRYIVPKGSIAVDGVSLTVAALAAGDRFEVALIPTTLRLTTLGQAAVGQVVNIEVDMLAKTVVHYLEHFLATRQGATPDRGQPGTLTMQSLHDAGFVT